MFVCVFLNECVWGIVSRSVQLTAAQYGMNKRQLCVHQTGPTHHTHTQTHKHTHTLTHRHTHRHTHVHASKLQHKTETGSKAKHSRVTRQFKYTLEKSRQKKC